MRQDLKNPPTAVGGIKKGVGPALRRLDLNLSTHSRGWDWTFCAKPTRTSGAQFTRGTQVNHTTTLRLTGRRRNGS